MHDITKVVLGSTRSSDKLASCEEGDPATFLAGLAVKRSSTGALSLTTGELIGVSLGESLSDHKKTSVLRAGNQVPLCLTNEGDPASLVKGDLTFTAKDLGPGGNAVTIAFITGGTAGSEVVTVNGKAISVSMAGGVSTATQLKAKLDASPAAVALITTTISGTAGNAQAAFVVDNLENGADDYAYAAIGKPVLLSSTTGKAASTGDATNAIYITGVKTGVRMDASEAACAVIDMGGGL